MNLHIFDNQIKSQNDKSLSIEWNGNKINFLLEKKKKKNKINLCKCYTRNCK